MHKRNVVFAVRRFALPGGRRSLLALLLVLMLIGTAGCFIGPAVEDLFRPPEGHSDIDMAGVSSLASALPAPSTLVRTASAVPLDADVNGADYDGALGSSRVAVQGTSARFTPNWVDAETSGAADLAYAIFAFDSADQCAQATLTYGFGTPPADWGAAWLLQADYASDRWWVISNLTAGGSRPLVNVPQYANPANECLVAFVFTGTQPVTLDTLRLTPAAPPAGLTNIFFLHHSTGAGLVFEGDMRGAITAYNAAHSTSYEFWDHGYQGDGLTDPTGDNDGTNYGPNTDYTDPPNLRDLWCNTADAEWTALRTTILANHEVIAFKSCFPASAIPDTSELEYRQQIYLEMRDFFDTRPDKLFVVVSTPPLRSTQTSGDEPANARAFANWLKSSDYLSGHPNVVCFDLFDALAAANDSGAGANTLRTEYEIAGQPDNSHPNALANQTVGPQFAEFLCDAAGAYTPSAP